jgi:hypothetical protein
MSIAHIAFELLLIISLVVGWKNADVRGWLLIAPISHIIRRLWSAFYFIPRALRFERKSS